MTTTDTASTPAPPRLARPHDSRMVAGVCSGLARYFDIDPIILRIVFAVLAVFGGAGVVLYVIGWLLIPQDGAPQSWLEERLARHHRTGRDWLVLALVAVGVIVAAASFSHSFPRIVVGLAAVVAVVLLLSHERRRGRAEPVGPATAGAPAATPTVDVATAESPGSSPLGWLTLSATLLVGGVLAALAIGDVADLSPADVIAAMLGVLGLGLLVGARWGRAWSLIPVGLALLLAFGAARAVPAGVPWTSGDRMWVPTASTLDDRYALGAGDARLDLSQVDFTADHSVSARLGAGRLVVVVPADVVVDVHAHAGAGKVNVLGALRNGTSVDDDLVSLPADGSPTAPRLTLDLRIGFGNVEVDRAAA